VLLALQLLTGLLLSLQDRMLYPFDPTPAVSPGFERVAHASHDGLDLVGWRHLPADPAAPLVVFFMGNAGTLAAFEPHLELHRRAGHGVLAMGYRGGGGLPGRPSEAALKADALAFFDALPGLAGPRRAARGVHLHGFSLGTGLALHVAAEREVRSVILEAPFTRVCDVLELQTDGRIEACAADVGERWDNAARIAAVSEPVLVLHGGADAVVPPALGAEMGRRAEAGGGAFVAVPDAGHGNTLWRGGWSPLRAWVARH